MSNPYEDLASVFGGDRRGAPGFRRGTVKKLDPLTVQVAGTAQSGNIYVDAHLMPGAARKGSVSGELTVAGAEGVSGAASGRDMTLTASGWGIAPGDEVLLLSENDQSFILICKVVRA